MNPPATAVSRRKLVGAFAAIYLIWGSTFLGIRFAIETLPPFLMASARHLIAGVLLYAWIRTRKKEKLGRKHWIPAFIVGGLLLMCGNGGVAWAEQRVASGLAALLVATVPLWMVLMDSLQRGVRPGKRVIFALLLGIIGLTLLVGPDRLMGAERIDPLGAVVLVGGSLCWAAGSLYARKAPLPSGALGTAAQMLAGGILLLPVSLAAGEWQKLDVSQISMTSLLAFGYLIVFGSLVGFTAYVWLLGHASPARVSTYAYVNPVVAVALGWLFAREPLTLRTALAAAVIVSAVALIISDSGTRSQKSPIQHQASEQRSATVETEMVST